MATTNTLLAGTIAVAFAMSAPTSARAGGLDLSLLGARAAARAGAVVVSTDGAEALVVNPAGIARRDQRRAQIGAVLTDSNIRYDADGGESPTIRDHAAPAPAAVLGFQIAVGPVVIGASYLELADFSRRLPALRGGEEVDDIDRLFPHRYAGITLRHQSRAVVAGAAVRATDWLGVGASVSLARVELAETRHVWAGFDGRDPIASSIRDLQLGVAGVDPFVPGVHAGILVAPPPIPVEIAISGSLTAAADIDADAALARARSAPFPEPDAAGATARARMAPTLVARAGVRYLGERFAVEVSAQDTIFLRRDDRLGWQLDGVTAEDDTGVRGGITAIDSLATQGDHLAVAGAVDVEVVAGFLWVSAGYGFRTASGERERLAPVSAALDSHLIAGGVEANWNGTTVTLGYTRALAATAGVSPDDAAIELVNPFDAGTAPANAGTYDVSSDTFAVGLELAWE